jgi:pSer/pThr/pTyr-binding forkhead associated (FHA) protein
MECVTLRHLSGTRAPTIEVFPLDGCVALTIGRDPEALVRFDPDRDGLVSRAHARIVRLGSSGHRFVVQDLHARNGTYVNRRRVDGDMPLHAGDVLQLGAGGPELAFDIVRSAPV